MHISCGTTYGMIYINVYRFTLLNMLLYLLLLFHSCFISLYKIRKSDTFVFDSTDALQNNWQLQLDCVFDLHNQFDGLQLISIVVLKCRKIDLWRSGATMAHVCRQYSCARHVIRSRFLAFLVFLSILPLHESANWIITHELAYDWSKCTAWFTFQPKNHFFFRFGIFFCALCTV